MSATDTAIRVIQWATSGDNALPQGDLHQLTQLLEPNEELTIALQTLVTVTAARARLRLPLLGDKTAVSCDAAMMAAALGGLRQPQFAYTIFARIIAPAVKPMDWIARHGLAGRVLAQTGGDHSHLSNELVNACLLASPLTALLHFPLEGQQNTLLYLVQQLLADSFARRWLQLSFAPLPASVTVRRWRAELFERLRLTSPECLQFVLDIYEANNIYYHEPTTEATQQALTTFTQPNGQTDKALQVAEALARWWQPLWQIAQTQPDLLRSRRYLGYEYRLGMRLVTLVKQQGL